MEVDDGAGVEVAGGGGAVGFGGGEGEGLDDGVELLLEEGAGGVDFFLGGFEGGGGSGAAGGGFAADAGPRGSGGGDGGDVRGGDIVRGEAGAQGADLGEDEADEGGQGAVAGAVQFCFCEAHGGGVLDVAGGAEAAFHAFGELEQDAVQLCAGGGLAGSGSDGLCAQGDGAAGVAGNGVEVRAEDGVPGADGRIGHKQRGRGGAEIRVNGLQHGEDVFVAVSHDGEARGFDAQDQIAQLAAGET